MPLPASMNPLQHRVPLQVMIDRQCTPKASGASIAACQIVRALLSLDGMAPIRTQSHYDSGFYAALCRKTDRELTRVSSGLIDASRFLLELAETCEATGMDPVDRISINDARTEIRNWENQ